MCAARLLGVPADAVLVASTGVIGMQIPDRQNMQPALRNWQRQRQIPWKHGNWMPPRAIMTTDTVNKEVAVQIELGGKTVTLGGMCKGSGMIHPNMCTMLGFVTTDACISQGNAAERR